MSRCPVMFSGGNDASVETDDSSRRRYFHEHGLQYQRRSGNRNRPVQFRNAQCSERTPGPRYAGYFLHYRKPTFAYPDFARAGQNFARSKGEPVKILCPGKVYRRDDDDATHSHQFMQFEGLVVGPDITMSDLKGTLSFLSRSSSVRPVKSVLNLLISRSPNRASKSTSAALNVGAKAARCASKLVGLKFSAPAWFIRMF